jgi:ribosomal subunit interface protein
MDIVVKGRNVEIPDHYRAHVAEKLRKVERYDEKLIRVDVELFHERNPRQSDNCQRIEITCVSRGPVVRAEACSSDFYSALDSALAKLQGRLRRSADRRRVHRGRRSPLSVATATAPLAQRQGEPIAAHLGELVAAAAFELPHGNGRFSMSATVAPEVEEYDDQPWHLVREKEHAGDPMTVDDALFHMELLGHDFYLFLDKESGRPSVVYRRRAYDYGLISLSM